MRTKVFFGFLSILFLASFAIAEKGSLKVGHSLRPRNFLPLLNSLNLPATISSMQGRQKSSLLPCRIPGKEMPLM